MKITQEQYKNTIESCNVFINFTKTKIELYEKYLETDPDDKQCLTGLEKSKRDLEILKKNRRRAMCRIYDYKYYWNSSGRQKRIDLAKEHRRKVWEIKLNGP